jgi:peroxiredoxin
MRRDLLKFLSIGTALFFAVALIGSCAQTGSTASSTAPSPVAAADVRGTSIGQLAPDFTLPQTDGTEVSLKDLEGSPAVLVFWTAWCPSCKEEAPKINKLVAEFGAKGVKVVGINIGDSDARVAEGIKDFGIKYAVARDKDASVSKNFRVVGTPTVLILDKKGIVRYVGNELPTDYSATLEATL